MCFSILALWKRKNVMYTNLSSRVFYFEILYFENWTDFPFFDWLPVQMTITSAQNRADAEMILARCEEEHVAPLHVCCEPLLYPSPDDCHIPDGCEVCPPHFTHPLRERCAARCCAIGNYAGEFISTLVNVTPNGSGLHFVAFRSASVSSVNQRVLTLTVLYFIAFINYMDALFFTVCRIYLLF